MENSEAVNSVKIIQNINVDSPDSNLNILTAAFRVLRNYCAEGKQRQDILASHDHLLPKTKNIVQCLLANKKECGDVCLLVSLQFVANFVVDNKENQCIVWSTFYDALMGALHHKELKIKNCALMIVYNVLLNNDDLLNQADELIMDVIALTREEVTAEYAVFIIELFVSKTAFVAKQFKNLEKTCKLIVLGVIESLPKNTEGQSLPRGILTFFSLYFIEKSHYVLEADPNQMEASEAHEISLVLDLINSIASSNSVYLAEIQELPDLLIHAIGLLRSVHALSKEKGNQFSMLLKLADLEVADRSDRLEEHPGFGFKGALVRLVGNMCWRHRQHQDTAREMDVIPLILDCCNIDARNPLIIQWAVLAMRNLCEDNLENQRVVACVDRKGQVDGARLAQLGLHFNGSGQ